MKYKLILDIAQSLLFARWKQTLVAAIGVTFSIAMFVTLLSFMTGLNGVLDGLILNRTPHIKIYNEIEIKKNQPINNLIDGYNFIESLKPSGIRNEIYNSLGIINALNKDKRIRGTAAKVSMQTFFTIGSMELNGMISGIEVNKEIALFDFASYVLNGNPNDLQIVPNSIILGKGLADKLLASIDDMVYATTSKGEIIPLRVVGYYQSGLQEIDKVQCYASIGTVQKLLGKSSNYISEIQVKLHDVNKAPELAKEYEELFGITALDIQKANAQFETGSSIRSLISYAVGITLLIVAGFGIYNILNMMIYEKMDTIAILKATGFSGIDVKYVFISIALSIGIFGGVVGLTLGYLMSYGISNIPFEAEALPTIKTFPVNFDPIYYIIGITFAVITTYYAGLLPARKASKIDPVIIIRGK